ncbi:MAG: hypothetical protein J0M33_03600 [Anaerolineae bacterium]|nr:hypothetical protein [Anaerolineae bacterium]
MAKLKGQTCYYCGAPAVSREHIPPKEFFKGHLCDSITVPSCDLHNSQKSQLDQAVMSALLIPLKNERHIYKLDNDVQVAITNAEANFNRAKRLTSSASLISDLPAGLLPNVAYLRADIYTWIRQVVAGLFWYAIKRRDETLQWDQIQVWSPDWLPLPLGTTLSTNEFHDLWHERYSYIAVLEKMNWVDGWSSRPRPYPKSIFYFQTHMTQDEVNFKIVFFEKYRWYISSTPKPQIIEHLKRMFLP